MRASILVVAVCWLLVGCGSSEPPPTPPIGLPEVPTPTELVNDCGSFPVVASLVNSPLGGEVYSLNSTNTGGIIGDSIRTLTLSQDSVWIGMAGPPTTPSAVAVYDGGSVEACGDIMGTVPNGHVNAIEISKDGRVWVGTDGNGVYKFDGFWHHYTETVGLSDDRVYDLYLQPDGVIAATWEGLSTYSDLTDTWVTRTDWLDDAYAYISVHSLLVHESGMWVGTINSGVVRAMVYENGQMGWSYYTADDGLLPSNAIRNIVADPSQENIWIAMDGGLMTYNPEENFWIRQQPPDVHVMAVDFDRHGRAWIATLGGVYYQGDGKWLEYYSGFPTLDLVVTSNDFVLIASDGAGMLVGDLPAYPPQ